MIKHLAISGFRGAARPMSLDFGQITLLSGRNGLGKTTVFDAIDWCLFGPTWRLGSDPATVRNIYDPRLDPIVHLELEAKGEQFLLTRTGESAFLNGSRVSNRDLLKELLTDPEELVPYARDLDTQIRRLIYLSQEDIRGLVHPEHSSERAALFQALLGVPSASLAQSGVRRVQKSLREREKELRLRLTGLNAARNAALERIDRTVGEGSLDASAVAEARDALKAGPTALLDDLVLQSRERIDQLTAAGLRLDELLAAIESFRKRRSSLEQDRIPLVAELEKARASESFDLAAVTAARVAYNAAAENTSTRRSSLRLAEAERREAEAMLERRRRIAQLIVAKATAEDSRLKAERLGADLQIAINDLRGRIEASLTRRRVLFAQRLELADRREQQLQRKVAEDEQQGALAALEAVLETRRSQEDAVRVLAVELDALSKDLDTIEREYHSLQAPSKRADVLRALLEQVRTVMPENCRSCPLCGSLFRSESEFMNHIDSTLEEYTRQTTLLDRTLQQLRRTADLVANTRTKLENASMAVASTERDILTWQSRLADARSRLESPVDVGDTVDRSMEELDSLLGALDGELATCKKELDDAVARLGTTDDDASRARMRSQGIDDELADLNKALGAEDDRFDESELDERLHALRIGEETAAAALHEARTAEDASAYSLENAERTLKATRLRIDDLGAQLLMIAEMEAAEASTLKAQLDGVVGDQSVDGAAAEVLRQRLENGEELLRLRRIWSQLVALSAAEQAKTAVGEIASLDTDLAGARSDLRKLLYAQRRFGHIAQGLAKSGEAAAAHALTSQKHAIQECFSTIYPHRHLNEVTVDAGDLGNILVTDARLRHSVSPSMYLSTGQANVLALGIFLGMALRQQFLKIGVLCLDEPVQHLDDLNFLGFVGLLKRVALSRQVVLSTADSNVAEILTRQMNSSWVERVGDFVRHDWRSFDPESGPVIDSKPARRQAVA
jgi:DNA repair protein SbcC/Rad50